MLLGLWLFIQLNPVALLFGAGDLRDFLAPIEGRARRPEFFVSIEAFTTAANLVAVGLLLSVLVAPGWPARAMFGGLVIAALAVKSAAFAILMRAENVFAWLTHGAQLGLAVGIAAVLAAARAPRTAAPRARRGAADGGDGAGQPHAAESVPRRFAQGLAAGPLPQLQRPHARW